MRAALRPYTTAGVALVGASVIAVSPLAPPVPDMREAATKAVSDAHVQLSALVNPIEEWAQVFETAFVNAAAIGARIAADPAPILAAIGGNQAISAEFFVGLATNFVSAYLVQLETVPAAAQAAIELIRQGQIQQGVYDLVLNTTLAPIVLAAFESGALEALPNVAAVLGNPFENVSNVIATVLDPLALLNLIPVILEPIAPILQLAATAQQVYDGLEADDYEAAVNALISLPSDMANTVINGSPDVGNGGLIGPELSVAAAILGMRELIAPAITPPLASEPALMSEIATFSPVEAGDTGLRDGQLVSLNEGAESPQKQQDPADAKVKTADQLTNSGATTPLAGGSGNATSGSAGAATRKPGDRLRAAFEGTAERIDKGFNDAVKGFDNALKGVSARVTSKDQSANAGAGADAKASEGSSGDS